MRWQLTEPHYLNVPGTKWEYQIQDRITGRQVRKSFSVPMHLHPESDVDWNRMDGQQGLITVCHEGGGHPDGRDIVFIGDPTPGMLPLDDEAKALSATFSWTPTQGIDDVSQSNSFANQMLNGLIKDMAELQAGVRSAPQAEGLGELVATMREMMQAQMQMFQMMMAKQAMPQVVIAEPEQVIDEEEPIEDAMEPTAEEIAEAEEASRVLEAESVKRAEAIAASGKTVPPRMRRA
jgi:hypothetical protein